MHRLLPWIVAAGGLFSAGGYAEDGEWSRFRGPNGAGISHATTVPAKWTEQDYNWKVALPGVGHSSPVVWGHRVFVTCGNAETAERTVLCLDAADGRPRWRHDYPSATFAQHRDSGYATATPAVDAGGVIVTWTTPAEVTLLALDLDGHQLWRRNLGPFVAVQGSGSSPIIVGDLVVLANDQENPSLIPGHKKDPPEPIGKSFLIAVDRQTGRTRWKIERPTAFSSLSTPCVYRREDGRQWLIFTSTLHGITLVDPSAGKIDWELDQKFVDRCVSSPLLAADLVIAGYGAGLRGTRTWPCGWVRRLGGGNRPWPTNLPGWFPWCPPPWPTTVGFSSGPTTALSPVCDWPTGNSFGRSASAGPITVRPSALTIACTASPRTARWWCWPPRTGSSCWPAYRWASRALPRRRLPAG